MYSGGPSSPECATARNPSARTLRGLPARYPESIVGGDLNFAGELLQAYGTAGRERDLAALFQSHRGDPLWGAWQAAYARARGAAIRSSRRAA